jgi:serine/threonine-protein kinase
VAAAFLHRGRVRHGTAGTSSGRPGSLPPQAGAGASGAKRLSPEDIEAARRLLARHIGPIADILVRRSSLQVGTRRALYERLASFIDDEAERRRFLAEAPPL